MDEALNFFSVFQHGAGHCMGPHDIRPKKRVVVINGASDMTLGGKVNNIVAAADKGIDQLGVANIPIPKFKSGVPASLHREVLGIPRVGQQIENQDFVVRILVPEMMDKIASDKSGAAGHKDGFLHVPSNLGSSGGRGN